MALLPGRVKRAVLNASSSSRPLPAGRLLQSHTPVVVPKAGVQAVRVPTVVPPPAVRRPVSVRPVGVPTVVPPPAVRRPVIVPPPPVRRFVVVPPPGVSAGRPDRSRSPRLPATQSKSAATSKPKALPTTSSPRVLQVREPEHPQPTTSSSPSPSLVLQVGAPEHPRPTTSSSPSSSPVLQVEEPEPPQPTTSPSLMLRVKEPDHPPLRDLSLLSGGSRSRVPSSNRPTTQIDLKDFPNPNRDRKLSRHIGYNVQIQLELLRMKRFRAVLAYAATCAWSHREVRMIALCSAGKHRSVAFICLLTKLFHVINPDIVVNVKHLAAPNWAPWTCEGKCPVCLANRTPVEMLDLLNRVKNSMPCQAAAPEVMQY